MITKLGKILAVFMIAALIFSSFAVIVSSESEDLGMSNKSEVKQTSEELAWPSRQHDSKNTGRSPLDTTHVDGTEKWNYTFNTNEIYDPVIGNNGTIYVGSKDGNLYAIQQDGSLKWKFDTRGEINATPSIGSDGTIYVTSTPNKLFATNPDGTQKWRMELGKNQKLLAVGNDDTIYVRYKVKPRNKSDRTHFTAISPEGTIKWNYSTYRVPFVSPAINEEGTIYMITNDYYNTYLHAFNPNGTVKWNTTIHVADMLGIVIGNQGDIYITSFAGLGLDTSKILAFSSNGTKKWEKTLEYGAVSPAIGNDGTLYVGCSPTESSSPARSLYAIYPNGTVKWHNNYGGGASGDYVYAPPSIGGEGTIYISSKSKSLFAVYPNGSVKWEFTTGEPRKEGLYLTTPAIGSDGTIYITGCNYFSSKDSTLYAIGGTPSEPQNVQISSDDGKIDLYWSSPSENGGSEITGYRIYRGNGSENLTLIDEVDRDTTSYTDMDLEDGQTYYYQVSAFTDVGEGDRSEIANITLDDKTDPNADAGEDKTVNVYEEVTFDASGSSDNVEIVSYMWTIDGTEYDGMTVDYTFNQPGDYTVELNVSDEAGNWDTDTVSVMVNDETSPTADAGEDKTVNLGEEVTFDATGSSDNVGIVSYTVTIDGTENEGMTVDYTFKQPGDYTVELNVSDEAGNWDTDTVSVTVNDETSPTSDAGEDRTVKVDEEVTFDASDSSDNVGITSYEWDFDDGSTAIGKSVDHKFDEKGTYEVTLTVTDEAGNTDTDTVTITVEKKDDGENGIPGFTILTLLFSITVITIYRYRKRL